MGSSLLWLSWKKPLFGAIVYTVLGVLYITWIILGSQLPMLGAILAIGIPSIIIGVLYFMDYKL